MAKARTAPATAPKRAPKLAVDGGTPPPPPSDEQSATSDPSSPQGPAVASPAPAPVDDPGWSRETVRALVGVPFLLAHLVAARRGPDDAWLPTDSELDVMASPLHNIAQRSLRLRALARFGDGVAFVTATGSYTVAESRRIADWRATHTLEAAPSPDADLAGLGTRVAAAAEPQPEPRAWRPPVVPKDEP